MPRKQEGCPVSVIGRLKRSGHVPKDRGSLISLDALQVIFDEIWNNEWYVKRILKKYPSKTRRNLTIDPNFSKVDRYIFNLFLKNLESGRSIGLAEVASLVKEYKKVNCNIEHLRSIRRKAYYFRETQRKSDGNE